MEGKVVSHYEIVRQIGKGGMGVVYKAHDTRLHRDVALKFLDSSVGRDLSAKERFVGEARAASVLDHPNVCTVFDVDETDDGLLFIAMALCEGASLEERIRAGPLEIADVLTIARQVASGLQAAHDRGIIHRDLKPGNVILLQHLKVKIVDFGLAKIPDQHLTRSGTTLGTVAYMSPEQVNGNAVDARTDIWSFGVLLYQMLTGRLPFHAPYEPAMMYRILHEPHDSLTDELSPEFEWLAAVIDSCLEKDPAMRPGSMQEIIDWLNERLPETEKRTAVRPAKHRRKPRQPTLYAGAGVLIVLMLGLALLFARQPAIPAEKYLVVLPLTAVSDREEDRLLADGLTSTLSNKLAQLASFTDQSYWVVPHSEVRSRGIASPSDAERAFGATMVLDGNLLPTTAGLSLNFNLIDVKSLRTLRAIDFAVDNDGLASLQDDAVNRVVQMLEVELHPGTGDMLLAGRTRDREANDLYLKGLALAERFERRENLDSAIVYFERALERDRDFALAHAGLGEVYWRLYENTRDEIYVPLSTPHLDRALRIEPRLAEAHIALARVYSGTDRAAEAIESINRAITLEPSNADAYLVLGRIYDEAGQVEEAESTFRKAINMRPSYWAGYNELGVFYYRKGRYSEAVEQYNKVITLTPDNARGYTNLGAAFYQLDRLDDAEDALKRSVKISPTGDGYSNLATFYYAINEMENAVRHYKNALNVSDENYALWMNLGSAYSRLGRIEDQREAYREGIRRAERQLRLNPGDQRAAADVAMMYAALDNPERAATTLASLDLKQVTDIEILFLAAETYAGIGEGARALELACDALEAGYSYSRVEQAPAFQKLRQDRRYTQLQDCKPD